MSTFPSWGAMYVCVCVLSPWFANSAIWLNEPIWRHREHRGICSYSSIWQQAENLPDLIFFEVYWLVFSNQGFGMNLPNMDLSYLKVESIDFYIKATVETIYGWHFSAITP